MKMNLRSIAVAALIAVSSSFVAAHAQNSAVQMSVPFAFDYGSQHFAAGTYTLHTQGAQSNPHVMILRSGQRSVMAMAQQVNHVQRAKSCHVVFNKYGDRYFLEQVWQAGSATYLAVYESKWEKRAARESASQGIASSQVELTVQTAPSAAAGE